MPDSDGQFKSQEAYGALTIGERSLAAVMAYAARQKEHHKERSVMAVYERIDED